MYLTNTFIVDYTNGNWFKQAWAVVTFQPVIGRMITEVTEPQI